MAAPTKVDTSSCSMAPTLPASTLVPGVAGAAASGMPASAVVRTASPLRSDPFEPISQCHDRGGLDPQMLDQFADAGRKLSRLR